MTPAFQPICNGASDAIVQMFSWSLCFELSSRLWSEAFSPDICFSFACLFCQNISSCMAESIQRLLLHAELLRRGRTFLCRHNIDAFLNRAVLGIPLDSMLASMALCFPFQPDAASHSGSKHAVLY